MDRPKKLVLDDGSYTRLGLNTALVGFGFVIVVIGGLALTHQLEGATLTVLALPIAAFGTIWLVWLAFHIIVGSIHKFRDKRDINRLFEQEIWQNWQFRSDEWQSIVEAEYQKMYSEGEGGYIGAVYSGITGLLLGVFMIVIGKFVIKDEQVMPFIFIGAAVVLLLLIGIGLFQPLQERNKARIYRRKALRILQPRVWFGAEGVYHEASGYTSLKELKKVSHTKTRQTIKFTIEVTSGGGDEPMATYDLPVSFAVPTGYEQQAAHLVRRYRQERLPV